LDRRLARTLALQIDIAVMIVIFIIILILPVGAIKSKMTIGISAPKIAPAALAR